MVHPSSASTFGNISSESEEDEISHLDGNSVPQSFKNDINYIEENFRIDEVSGFYQK